MKRRSRNNWGTPPPKKKSPMHPSPPKAYLAGRYLNCLPQPLRSSRQLGGAWDVSEEQAARGLGPAGNVEVLEDVRGSRLTLSSNKQVSVPPPPPPHATVDVPSAQGYVGYPMPQRPG